MRFILVFAVALVISVGAAHARCSEQEAQRAMQELKAYIDQNPHRKDQIMAILQQVTNEYGNPTSHHKICEIVNQVMIRAADGGR